MLQTAIPKTADQLIGRMTEVEKCIVRNATNPDRLEYLRQTAFAYDMISPVEMEKLKATLDARYTEASKSDQFGCTWLF
jgi:DNA replication protein DnaD